MGRKVRTVLPGTKKHTMNICQLNTIMPITHERLDIFFLQGFCVSLAHPSL